MVKILEVSDEAYAVIIRYASFNGESTIRAVDELMDAADQVWVITPEMRKVWKEFKEYSSKSLPSFEGMR